MHLFTTEARRSLRRMIFFLSVEKDRKEKTTSYNAGAYNGRSDTNAFFSAACRFKGLSYYFPSFPAQFNTKSI